MQVGSKSPLWATQPRRCTAKESNSRLNGNFALDKTLFLWVAPRQRGEKVEICPARTRLVPPHQLELVGACSIGRSRQSVCQAVWLAGWSATKRETIKSVSVELANFKD